MRSKYCLQVILLSTEMLDDVSMSSYPTTKHPYSARISIEENDNPYGELHLVSSEQTNNSHLCKTKEIADFSFIIYIERKGI